MDSATPLWSMSRTISGYCTKRSSRADLDAGLRQLPEALRAALILTAMEGYSLEDLTTIFGWSKPRTQIALATARQLLDRSLQARLTTIGVSPAPEVKDAP